ncbi:MAG: hypothetical protein QM689_01255 [Oscillospiraceae bacterium]
MKKRKLLALVLAAALGAGALSACADKNDSSASGSVTADPANYYNPQPVDTGYTWGNVTIGGGGYVPGIVINPTEEGVMYARTDMGGAYRWNKIEQKWESITDYIGGDDWNYNGAESIATDPVEPNRVYMALGTYSNSNGAIFYSYDYGDNWTKVDLPFGCGANEVGRSVGERLMVDPDDNSIIYFATRHAGLYVQRITQEPWTPVASFPTEGGYVEKKLMQVGLSWVTFDQSSA